jgi:hypothetical protein
MLPMPRNATDFPTVGGGGTRDGERGGRDGCAGSCGRRDRGPTAGAAPCRGGDGGGACGDGCCGTFDRRFGSDMSRTELAM